MTRGRLPLAGSRADTRQRTPGTVRSRLGLKVLEGVTQQTLVIKKKEKSQLRGIKGRKREARKEGTDRGHADKGWRGKWVVRHVTPPPSAVCSESQLGASAPSLPGRERGVRGTEREERQSVFAQTKTNGMHTA